MKLKKLMDLDLGMKLEIFWHLEENQRNVNLRKLQGMTALEKDPVPETDLARKKVERTLWLKPWVPRPVTRMGWTPR